MSKLVELNLDPDRNTLRQFGVIAFIGFGLLGVLAYYDKLIFAFGLGSARLTVVAVLVGIGNVALVFSLVFPKANRFLYVGLTILAFPIGFVLSYVIIGTLNFLIIGPISILFRLFDPDAMHRRYDLNAPSYWTEAKLQRDKESYFHQY